MAGQTKILFVAALDQLRTDLASRLTEEGAEVTLAETGEEVLASKPDSFDLVLLDLELLDGEALSVLPQIHGHSNGNGNGMAHVPVLLLKGEGEPAHIVQRGFDFGASGYVIKHRLPRDLSSARILDRLLKAVSATDARPDSCPYSSRHEFGRCSVFLPLSIAVGEEGSEPLVSCSHLRIGTSDTWRLYPRCAIGDQAARDRYLEGKAAV